MKKMFLLVLLSVLLFCLGACSRHTSGEGESRQPAETVEDVGKEAGETMEGENETEPERDLNEESGVKMDRQSMAEDGSEIEGGEQAASKTTEEIEERAATEAKAETAEETKWEWQHDLPENHGLDTAALEAFHISLDSTDVLAAVIVRDDRIVDEYYKEGYDETSVFALHSCSKSITSALLGISIDQGLVEGVDVPVTEYFPQAAQSDGGIWNRMTIWHLLTHTSGVSGSDTDDWESWRSSDNWVDFVLNRPVTSEPGTTFRYFTGNSHLLAAIVQKASGRTLYDFGREYLFEPLGMDSVRCETDAQGISDGGNGFSMNVYDMAKFGRLFLRGGDWEGRQIISEEWVRASTSLQFKRSDGSADYGYQWWVRTFGEEKYDAFFAQGHFGQYIFCVPDLDLIIVFASHHTGGSGMYWQYVSDIVAACSG